MWTKCDKPHRHPCAGFRFRSQVSSPPSPLAGGWVVATGLTVPHAFDPRISQNSFFPVMVLVRSVRNSFAQPLPFHHSSSYLPDPSFSPPISVIS